MNGIKKDQMTNTPKDSRLQDLAPSSETSPPFASHSIWSGFYKKALRERQSQLKLMFPHLFQEKSILVPERTEFPFQGLNEEHANNMIENCIGTMGLPVGLALNLTMNGKMYVVPMAIEEPSVVAAVSGASKTISQFSLSNGFTATSSERNVVYAQVQLLDIPDDRIEVELQKLNEHKETIISNGNQFCQSMMNRGGGVIDVTIRKIKRQRKRSNLSYWVVVHIHIDVCEAMGANCASTVAEGVSHYLERLTGARIGFRIVSNLCVERLSTATFLIPTQKLGYKDVDGHTVAERIIESYEWASDDPFRATTHNKGIMNGIDAVAIATGQDWRAIEAASHAWASLRNDTNQSGCQYGPLTKYWIEERDGIEYFGGELALPICVGVCGGVLKTNPTYSYALGLMGRPSSNELAMIMVCIGLAQNFAALRAMATEGIQRGHMSLHARNICIAAGAPSHAIAECVAYMIETGRINQSTVREYLEAHELQSRIWSLSSPRSSDVSVSTPASMFYFEEESSITDLSSNKTGGGTAGLEAFVTLNIAFPTLGSSPVHIELTPEQRGSSSIVKQLFSEKTFDWIRVAFAILDKLQYGTEKPVRSNRMLSRKLKYISVLMNLLLRGLSRSYPAETEKFLTQTLGLVSRTSSMFQLFSDLELEDHSDSFQEDKCRDVTAVQTSPEKLGIPLQRSVSGLLRENLHTQVEDIVLHHQSPDSMTSQVLQVGLPLFLALWQVFEYRVSQWVGNPLLADALIHEQRQVISSFVTPSDMHRHAKQFQATSILLCDAITLDATYINAERLSLLQGLGSFIEWEHSICHDVALDHLIRDVMKPSSSRVNGFVLWCREIKSVPESTLTACIQSSSYTEQLNAFIDEYRIYVRDVVLKNAKIAPQDLPVLDRARLVFQEYYHIAPSRL